MAAERKVIDVMELAEPGRLKRELGEHPEGFTVGERGRLIGTIVPEGELERDRDHEFDRRLDAIRVYGVDGSPLPDRRMTTDEVERLVSNGPIFSNETCEQLRWNRRFDRGLADIGGAIGPMPTFTFTPERLNRILNIIGSIKGIDADEMRRIVDEGRRLSPDEQDNADQAADTIRT